MTRYVIDNLTGLPCGRFDPSSVNIHIEYMCGSFKVVDTAIWRDGTVYLLDHQTAGDGTDCVIINEFGKVLLDHVSTGFEALDELPELPFY